MNPYLASDPPVRTREIPSRNNVAAENCGLITIFPSLSANPKLPTLAMGMRSIFAVSEPLPQDSANAAAVSVMNFFISNNLNECRNDFSGDIACQPNCNGRSVPSECFLGPAGTERLEHRVDEQQEDVQYEYEQE